MVRYRALQTAAFLGAHLPGRLLYGLAWFLALIAYYVNSSARTICEENVRHALASDLSAGDLQRAVRGCLRAAAYYYVDLVRTPRMEPAQFVHRNITMYDFQHIDEAYRSGKGVIVATIHYGNPEYVAQSMSALGYRFLALTEPLEPRALAELIQRLRSSQGQTFVEVGWTGMKQALRHLKNGGVVCIMCDRDIQRAGETVPFFGAPARIPSGAIDLARHTGATIIPALSRRTDIDAFDLFVEPPFALQLSGRWEEDRRMNTARLIQCFEKYLRDDPSQWFVLEQRIWGCASDDRKRAAARP